MSHRTRLLLGLALLAGVGCGPAASGDAGPDDDPDAGPERLDATAATDGGQDAALDAALDAGSDAGSDAGADAALPDLSITVDATPRWVAPGASTDVAITLERLNGFAGAVLVRLASPPAWASAPDRIIPTDSTSTVLTVTVTADAPRGEQTLTIEAVSADGTTPMTSSPLVLELPQPGDLDLRYGMDGVAQLMVGSGRQFVTGAELLSDGRLVAVGHSSTFGPAFIALLRADGSGDSSFSGNGFDSFGTTTDRTNARALAVDGTRFLVAYTETDGTSRTANNILAYDRTGSIINVGASNPEVVGDTCCSYGAIAVRASGFFAHDARIRGYTEGGAVDTSFATAGVFSRTGYVLSSPMKTDGTGRIYIRQMNLAPTPRPESLLRLSSAGVIDTAFESALPSVPTESDPAGSVRDFAIRPDGSGAYVGTTGTTSPVYFLQGRLVAFDSDGAPTFSGGWVSTSDPAESSGTENIALLSDGGFLVLGWRQPASERIPTLQRFANDGTRVWTRDLVAPDSSLEATGIEQILVGPDDAWVLVVGGTIGHLTVERRIL